MDEMSLAARTPLAHTLDELTRQYPQDLRLLLVQVVHRHGERTPVMPGLSAHFPPIHANCYMGSFLEMQARLASSSGVSGDKLSDRDIAHTMYRKSLFNTEVWNEKVAPEHVEKASPGICYHGQLTDKGRDSMAQLGQYFRSLYVDRLKLLPATLSDASTLFLRSTDYPRTLESLHSVLHGLYPPDKRTVNESLHIYTRTPISHDIPYFDLECARYRAIKRQFNAVIQMSVTEKLKQSSPLLQELVKEAGNDPVWAADIIASAIAHNQKHKVPLTQDDMIALNNMAAQHWFGHVQMYPVMRRFAIGRFLTELTELMEAYITPFAPIHKPPAFFSMHESHMERTHAVTPPKFALYSAHDTTILPLLLAFNAWDKLWPRFGSHVSFELFEDTRVRASITGNKITPPTSSTLGVTSSPTLSQSNTEISTPKPVMHYMRVRYNGKAITLPDCADSRDHYPGDSTLCKMDTFRKIVNAVAFKTQAEHKDACRINSTVM